MNVITGRNLKILTVLFFFAITTLQGCNGTAVKNPASQDPTTISATVKFIDIEGGFWGLISTGGEKYQPVNLGKEFKQDGLKVRVRARPLEDTVDFRMWGKQIEILEIKIQENKKSGNGNAG